MVSDSVERGKRARPKADLVVVGGGGGLVREAFRGFSLVKQ